MASRANVETILVKRVGGLLTAVGFAATYAGANTDLADPIGYAVRACGGVTADIASPTTAEVAAISADDADKLLDVAELRALETILAKIEDGSLYDGPGGQRQAALASHVRGLADRRREFVNRRYRVNQSQSGFTTGVMELDIMQTTETGV